MKHLLREIATIGAGQGAPQGDENYCDDGTPFVKAGNLSELLEGTDINAIQRVSEEVAKKHKLKKYPKGTILFAKSGMSCMKGYVYVLPQEAYVVSHLACITPQEDISGYLKYYFTYHKPNQLVKDAAYPSISLSDIGELEIDIKREDERTRIVSQLAKIESIMSLHQRELDTLDNLIKARFVELFGDDIVQANLSIGDIAEETTVGIANSATHAYVESGVVMLRNQNIRVNYLDDSDLIYINPEFASKYDNKKLRENDILVTRTGVNVGMACLVPEKYAGCQTFTTLILRLKKNIGVSPTFVCHYINSPLGKGFIDDKKVGGAQPNFGAKQLATMPIAIPSEDKQLLFESFVKQVDKSKVAVQKALNETQKLLDSLMQEYFG